MSSTELSSTKQVGNTIILYSVFFTPILGNKIKPVVGLVAIILVLLVLTEISDSLVLNQQAKG
jgi:uncharacterized membrane protein